MDQTEKLLAGTKVAAKDAAHRAGDGARVLLFDAPHRHAEVSRFDEDAHAVRLNDVHDRVGDLVAQPLLHLQPPGEYFNDARQLGEADDAAIGDVGDVGPAEEREQMVLTERIKLDVPHQDHALVVFLEHRVSYRVGYRHLVTAGKPAQRLLHPFGSLEQTGALRILTQSGQDGVDLVLKRLGPCPLTYLHIRHSSSAFPTNGCAAGGRQGAPEPAPSSRRRRYFRPWESIPGTR